MAKKATLVIDFGNSATRFNVIYDTESGIHQEHFHSVKNTFARLSDDYVVPDVYMNRENTFIEFSDDVYAHGPIVEREFSKSLIRPSTVEKKYNAQATELAVRYALYQGINDVAEFSGEIGSKLDAISKDIEWDIVALLPPIDVQNGKEAMRSNFKSIGSIQIAVPNAEGVFAESVKLNVKVDKVGVLPEGSTACVYALRQPGIDVGTINSMILVIDIGSGTTDVCVVKGGKLVSSSMNTIVSGGRNVQNKVAKALRSDPKIGGDYPEDVVANVVATGKLAIRKNLVFDVSDLVRKAKEEVAESINQGIVQYLEDSNFATNQIAYLLPVGGGAIRNEGIEPLSQYVCNNVLKSCHAEILPIPGGVSPRDLNVLGASMVVSGSGKKN